MTRLRREKKRKRTVKMTTPIEQDLLKAQCALDVCMDYAMQHAWSLRAETNDKKLPKKCKRYVQNAASFATDTASRRGKTAPTATDYANYRKRLCAKMTGILSDLATQLAATEEMLAALATRDAPPVAADKQ